MEMEQIGEYAFIVCVIIAGIAGLALGYQYGVNEENYGIDPDATQAVTDAINNSGWIVLVLVILGVIIGLTTITEKEASTFLMGAIALIVANVGFGIAGSGTLVSGTFKVIDLVVRPLGSMITFILIYITSFVAPAAVILALKAVYALARKA